MCAAAPISRERSRLLAFFLLLVSTAPAWALTSTPSWKDRELVADNLVNPNFTDENQLAFDHHGNPGIAYYDDVNNELRYARRVSGIGWVSGLVDDVGNTGQRPSLAFDRYERPAIAYLETGLIDVRFAHFDGTDWQTHLAFDGTDLVQQSLAFDLLGRPAIAVGQISGLTFIHDTDGDFRFDDETPVTVTTDFAIDIDLAFDALNRPHIVFENITVGGQIDIAIKDSGVGWVTGTIDDNGGPLRPSLAFDPETGFPAVAYGRGNGPWYAEWDGTTWNPVQVAPSFAIGGTSLAFDPADGNPAFVYQEGITSYDLYFAWHDGSSWQHQIVDSDTVGIFPSLAFNPFGNGFPSIAYTVDQGTFDDLYFIEDPPTLVPEPSAAVMLAMGIAGIFVRRRTHVA